ncbi:MAG: TrkH family potassium uptake protein [Eubacteriales bacterium]|jgi:trk system potassium uptake protein TrkH|nr:TrkH family potassium uptake protein [Eubacteriales bacterium]
MVLHRGPIIKVLSAVTVVVGTAMLLPMLVSLYYGERSEAVAFLLCSGPMIAMGYFVGKRTVVPERSIIRARDGFFIVGTAWLVMSLLGALPFVLSGSIPRLIDAYFETASGFTTTGASILTDIESLPRGMLFWRSFTHWLGGMGILVLTVALLPMLGIGGQKIMRAETTGPTMDKISFTINDTAKILYKIYAGMSLLQISLLMLGGLTLYDASVHTFGTVGTGGFSNYAASVGAYDSFYVDMVIGFFMIAAGVNFTLYHTLLSGKVRQFFQDFELKYYLMIVGCSTFFITAVLLWKDFYGNPIESFRYAFFQVASIITTTGFATADFDLWPASCKMILLFLMIVGACASSTGGGIKVIRTALVFKLIKRGAYRRLHPNAVIPMRAGDRNMGPEVMSGVAGFVLLYIFTTMISILLISLENVDLITAISSVVACISNIGPGFEMVGPTLNYSFYSGASKMLLSLLMIAGRLELFTIILLFTPVFWNRNK